jgi:EAL domain-containing protein (putative c-di-GMP-specific phosphodiesterase class I)
VESSTNKVICAEALARIRDGEGQIVFPDEFIFMAENIGEISAIGRQVMNKVCRFIREYRPEDYGIEWINVNLSPLQCMNLGLAANIVSILGEHQVEPDRIHLELTEEAMSDSPEFSQQVNNLMERGFLFSLDDYGKGYSNLNRIKQFSFSNIKLDMSIVWDYYDKRDILLPSMVQTFKAMGFRITAEGIESEDMAEVMSRIGCDYLQGFVYSRPIPMELFVQKYMSDRRRTVDRT